MLAKVAPGAPWWSDEVNLVVTAPVYLIVSYVFSELCFWTVSSYESCKPIAILYVFNNTVVFLVHWNKRQIVTGHNTLTEMLSCSRNLHFCLNNSVPCYQWWYCRQMTTVPFQWISDELYVYSYVIMTQHYMFSHWLRPPYIFLPLPLFLVCLSLISFCMIDLRNCTQTLSMVFK